MNKLMIISDIAKKAVAKLPPDILMHPMPFPDRLDYGEKIVQEAINEALKERRARALYEDDLRELSERLQDKNMDYVTALLVSSTARAMLREREAR